MMNPGLLVLVIVGLISSQCAIICCGLDKTVPLNYILLLIFTVCESFIVGITVMRVKKPVIVLQAAGLTLGIVVALTIYAARTKTDFTLCGSLLYTMTMTFMISSIFIAIFGLQMHFIMSAFAVFLFSFYLIYDTQMILNGTLDTHKQYKMDEDSYIMGAMMLYIDIIQLFLHILSLLNSNDD